MKESAGQKLWKRRGRKRPWKSLRDFHFSHSFNNNQRRFAPRTDRIHPGTVIGIRTEC